VLQRPDAMLYRNRSPILAVTLVVYCLASSEPSKPASEACNPVALDATADGDSQLSLLQATAGSYRANSSTALNRSRPQPSEGHVFSEEPMEVEGTNGTAVLLTTAFSSNFPKTSYQMIQELLREDPSSSFFVQASLFVSIFILIVGLIYCVSTAADSKATQGQEPAAASLLSREMYPPMSQRYSLEAHSSRSLAVSKAMALAPQSSAALQNRASVSADNWHLELPTISPALVIPAAHTRLAVPLAPLFAPQFEVDVLGLSGVPLLSAALLVENGARVIQICLHNSSNVLGVVTAAKEVLGADRISFGTLVKEDKGGDELTHTLRDRSNRPILAVTSTRRDRRDFKMTSISNGRKIERATAVRRPAGKLPAEHYEVVANPNVDAVLVLACFLGVLVFEQTLPTSGRPSVPSNLGGPGASQPDLNSAAVGSTGRYWGYRD